MAKSPKNRATLARLKEWFTVPDAARYLSVQGGGKVKSADVLRLALDGQMKLSVRFVNFTYAKLAAPEGIREQVETWAREMYGSAPKLEADKTDVPPPTLSELSGRDRAKYDQIVTLTDKGVFDLPMIGAERIDVENEYQQLSGGPVVTLMNIDGTFVDGPDEARYHLHERAPREIQTKDGPIKTEGGYIPAAGLPRDAVLLVRRNELERVVRTISGNDRPLETRERETLYAMIAALCRIAKLDIHQPTKVGHAIESETIRLGGQVSTRTVQAHLQRIRKLFGE